MTWWPELFKRKRKTVAVSSLLLTSGLLFGAIRLANPAPKIPTAEVVRKEFVDYLPVRGQVKAMRSVTIAAPFRAGDLQIIKLVDNGARVKKGDVVVEFDNTTVKQKLAQDLSALKSADAEIQQARASARMKEEQDVTDVMKSKYEAEKARMDAGKQEILSPIEGEEAKLKLADAEQSVKEAEERLKADRASGASAVASKQQKRDQAAFQVRLDQSSLEALSLRAPIDGMVSLLNNWRAAGPMGNPTLFKQGDRAWSGAAIAELPDLSTLKISARIEEAERGQLRTGQTVVVRIDAVPDRNFGGRVDEISATASPDFSAGWPIPRNFAVGIALDSGDPRLNPGMTANVRVAVDHVANAIVIPAQALFHKAGRAVIYVRRGSKFEEVAVEVARRNPDEVLITKGLRPGEQVALKDPTAEK